MTPDTPNTDDDSTRKPTVLEEFVDFEGQALGPMFDTAMLAIFSAGAILAIVAEGARPAIPIALLVAWTIALFIRWGTLENDL